MTSIRLELNSHGAYVVPGEVTGTVAVVIDQARFFNTISVALKGYADVHWTETYTVTETRHNRQYQRTETRHIQSHEDFITDGSVLWDATQSHNRILNSGQHNFPFRLALRSAERIPSSFVGEHGHIRYEIEAKISTAVAQLDQTVSEIIQVVDRVDINTPELLNPAQFEEVKTICCLCCASPQITMTTNIPRKGFCIGEGIPLSVSLENGSGRTMHLRATINKTETYRAEGQTRTNTKQISTLRSEQIEGRTTFEWKPTQQLAILSAIPSIANCDIITVEYHLLVEAEIPWAINAATNIPITLGNVPPHSLAGQQPLPQPQYPTLPTNAFVPYNPDPSAAQVPLPIGFQFPTGLSPSPNAYPEEAPPPF